MMRDRVENGVPAEAWRRWLRWWESQARSPLFDQAPAIGRRWLRWWDGKVRSLLLDLVVAVAVGWEAAADTGGGPIRTLGIVAGAVIGAGLLFRRRFPLVVAVVTTVGGSFVVASLSGVVTTYTVSSRRGNRLITWIAGVLGLAGMVIPQFRNTGGSVGAVLFDIPFMLTPLLAGLWMAQRRQLLTSLRERADQAERERDLLAERAVTAERHRIAREMHDIVAHRVSLVSLQAGALSVTSNDEGVTSVAELIRQTSVTALTELRDILRALRDDTDAYEKNDSTERSSLSPRPTLESIRELVDDTVAAGARIELQLPDPLPDVSTTVQRAAYRVVQESLTNAGKHAPGAPVEVQVTAGQEGMALQVLNSRSSSGLLSAVPGSGYGLLGMRERVSLAGGTLRSGPTDKGGFLVQAWFPVQEDGASDPPSVQGGNSAAPVELG